MITAVFDCVVYIQAAINDRGPAAACLSLAEEGQIITYASPAILHEVRETLLRVSFRQRFPHLTDHRVEEFMQIIVNLVELTNDPPFTFSLKRDPDDAVYVDLAIHTRVSHLVSRDKDLLSLMQQKAFCKAYPHLSVIDPAAFLAHVRYSGGTSAA